MEQTICSIRRRVLVALTVAGFALSSASALADAAYPSKSIRLLVGFSAGGAVDLVARQLAQTLTQQMGQAVVVDNRPGATGTIAADITAKAPADGYTLLLGTQSTMLVAPSLFPKLNFKPLQDFAPVSLIASVPLILVANKSAPVKTVKDVIELARSKGGELTYASAGLGGPQHVATELLAQMAGVKMVHIPYKGEANALTDLLGNQIPIMFGNLPTMLPQVQSGAVRAIAVSSLQRSPAAPDIPTVAESGLPGFEALTWFGLFAPANTPRSVIDQLTAVVKKALADPAMQAKLHEQGLTVVGNSPDEFRGYMQTETVKWAKLVEDAHIKPE